jgi:5-oxoprolinase (ATP-hydrolysing) subunit A
MPTIDLNCDMGESFGAWKMGSDAELMEYISSANIACGFHAGDPTTMRKTAELAVANNVAIGAHPGYADLQGFGRRAMTMKPEEVFDLVLYQVSALKGICESFGGRLHHVKAHGALYNQAAKDIVLAEAIALAVARIDPELILFGMSGSYLITEAEKLGLRSASEVFADRTYQHDGSLTPRTEPNALITETAQAISQVIQMIESQTVTAIDGQSIPLRAETICIHGDGPNAVQFAKAIRQKLDETGIDVMAI